MLSLKIFDFELHQKQAFKVSRESYHSQNYIIVELGNGSDKGYGEAVAFSVYGATVEGIHSAIESVRDKITAHQFSTPEKFWRDCIAPIDGCPFAKCALDTAAHDLYGKSQTKPLYELLGLDVSEPRYSNFSIGMDDCTIVKNIATQKADWPILKVKLGNDDDLKRIETIRQYSDAVIHVDANAGWNIKKTLEIAPKLADLGVKSIEQPLPVEDWEGAQHLNQHCPLPIIADESCFDEDSFKRCLNNFHGINIKLMKVGGITPALNMIRRAKAAGVDIMIGCMPETTIGASAIAHLSPLVDYVDMDSIEFLQTDLAVGIHLEKGKICHNHRPGLGFKCNEGIFTL